MRLGLWALAALFVGAFAAHFLLGDQGYVLIHFRGYVVEMSVPALVLTFVLLYALIRALKRLWRAPRTLGEAWAGRRSRNAGDRLMTGLMYMTEGDWPRGERLLTQGLKNSTAPLLNYVMAARAAHEQGARERRNEWLKLACEALPGAEVTVLLTQAEMQHEDGEFEQALATLQRIQDKEPDHRAALALTAKTKVALGDRARQAAAGSAGGNRGTGPRSRRRSRRRDLRGLRAAVVRVARGGKADADGPAHARARAESTRQGRASGRRAGRGAQARLAR
jgi:HemY protein